MFIVTEYAALSHIQKLVSNFHLCQLFTIKVYMPTVQFAEVPNKSSISNNCCAFAIMFIIQLMHSFEVNIRICQPENSDVHRGEAEVNITFEG